jgi:hypothetical protein
MQSLLGFSGIMTSLDNHCSPQEDLGIMIGNQQNHRTSAGLLCLGIILIGIMASSAERTDTGISNRVHLTVGKSVMVMHGPARDTPWGVYQFPDMWRGCDGAVYLCVNMGHDAKVGDREDSRWFKSDNNGASWSQIPLEQVDLRPDVVELPGGGAVSFGRERYVYHWSTYGPGNQWPALHPVKWGVDPVAEPFYNAYGVRYDAIYRFGDFPAEARRWPCRVRMPDGHWEDSSFSVEAPELRNVGIVRQKHWFEKDGKWEDIAPSMKPPVPIKITHLADGSLVTPVNGQHPEVLDRSFNVVHCLASVDGGRTWDIRGTVADQTNLVTHGFGAGEQEFVETENGDVLCFMRTLMSAKPGVSRELYMARSSDGGRNWSTPRAIAPVSVTPHVTKLKGGVLAVVYGRPGVHLAVSADGGVTWPARKTVVGPPESELLARPDEIRHGKLGDSPVSTCANTDLVPTGPDRFLIAYSDFRYPHPKGGFCKAVLTCEVSVSK